MNIAPFSQSENHAVSVQRSFEVPMLNCFVSFIYLHSNKIEVLKMEMFSVHSHNFMCFFLNILERKLVGYSKQ